MTTTEIAALAAMFCLTGLLIIFAVVMLGMWIWMFADWSKREKTDPAIHEQYKTHFLVGWPFAYYFQVYRKRHKP